VDLRLRPSGASGLLVTSLHAFGKYQREQAWVWEQQALVRARPVAGCAQLSQRFRKLRHELLCQPRDDAHLRQEVLAMRARMHASLDRPAEPVFHLKQDEGGIVDIEFMVQYGVLRWAHLHPELTTYTDNVRLLETLAAQDLMPAQDAGLLREAYLAFRSATHTQSLKNEPACVPQDQFQELRAGVRDIWKRWFALL
jgi:glutamate-ammonia-ligase adenylyltransferase